MLMNDILMNDVPIYCSPEEMAPFLRERRALFKGQCLYVAQPTSTEQVVQVLRFAQTHQLAVVPQGGNTGLVGGQIPRNQREIVLSLARLNNHLHICPQDNVAVVDAGITLQEVRQAASQHGRLFPLNLPSQAFCQIGGTIATNAGGTHVVRYGMMRQLVLGLEVVLADGTILNLNQPLIKNNNGYDLKQLFIGSEGTLGIITRATLRLFHQPACQLSALWRVDTLDQALEIFHTSQMRFGNSVVGFEIMCPQTVRLLAEFPYTQEGWYLFLDVAVAEMVDIPGALSVVQDGRFEKWRHALSDVQKQIGVSIKHDIGMLPSRMATFIQQARAAVLAYMSDVRFIVFGHLGDGNLHFNVMEPVGHKGNFREHWQPICTRVHQCALALGGSISAEHGIGLLKCQEMAAMHTSPVLHTMHAIKHLFDPKGLLNPGKVLPSLC